MSKDVKGYKLIIEQVDMREVFYNHDFEKAINAKKLAEQEVLRLVEVTRQKAEELKQAEINKNISIEQAKGDAEALKIKGINLLHRLYILFFLLAFSIIKEARTISRKTLNSPFFNLKKRKTVKFRHGTVR
jgi:hypothetical protein